MLLTYGLQNNELRHVSQVENGFACNCICPNCHALLTAKNNPSNIKVAHFAHYKAIECQGAIETALHLLAKNILRRTKKLRTPAYHYDYNPENLFSFFEKSREIEFENISIETSIDVDGLKIIVDAIGEIKGKNLLIEFAKTHFIDEKKHSLIIKSGFPCIEIDLNGQPLDEDLLTSFLNADTTKIYWISNPTLDKKVLDLRDKWIAFENLREQQEADEMERKRKELEIIFYKYKNDSSVKLILINIKNGLLERCPIIMMRLKKLESTPFYTHPVLKRIIDGEYWNKQMYGYPPNGRHIFLGQGGDKIIVYPTENEKYLLDDIEMKERDFFFAGLKKIKSISEAPTLNECSKCQSYNGQISFRGNYYVVCRNLDEDRS